MGGGLGVPPSLEAVATKGYLTCTRPCMHWAADMAQNHQISNTTFEIKKDPTYCNTTYKKFGDHPSTALRTHT